MTFRLEHTLCCQYLELCIMTVPYPTMFPYSVQEHNLYIVVTHIWFQPSWPHVVIIEF